MNETILSTPFGQLNGVIVHVNEVPFESRKEKFTCSCCCSRLQIIEQHKRAETTVSAHFRHMDKERICNAESVAHAYWKQVVVERVGKTMKFDELGECTVLRAENEVTLGIKSGFGSKLSDVVRVDCLQEVEDLNGIVHTVAIEINVSNKKKTNEIEIFQRLGINVYELTVDSKKNVMIRFENLNKFNAWKTTQRKNELEAEKSEIKTSNVKHELQKLMEKNKKLEQKVLRDSEQIFEDLKEEMKNNNRALRLENEELTKRISERSKMFDIIAKAEAKDEIEKADKMLKTLEAQREEVKREIFAFKAKHEETVLKLSKTIEAKATTIALEKLEKAKEEYEQFCNQNIKLEEELANLKKEQKGMLGATTTNELLCTRKVNEVLEARIKRANKALLESIKLGFKTDYKF